MSQGYKIIHCLKGLHVTFFNRQTNHEVLYCDEEIKPKVGQIFDSLEDGDFFYKRYAHSVGFSVRCSSENKNKDGVIRWKYFVCSKEGYKPNVSKENEVSELGVKVKRRSLTREGCDAKVAFKLLEGGKYELTRFQESHTHALASPKKRQFLRSARKVNNIHKSIMFANSRANIGPSKTYHLLKEQLGGYENIGCTHRDLQNSFRDLKTLIKDSDAYVFIDNFKRKQEVNPSFYFAYEVDVEDRLKHVFWADGICRKNYFLFGDVMSFDTTYETNKYSMIFAPFTGVNHHRQSVTFGAAFLANEKADSFIWLFEKFLEAMGGNKPNLIITDQDPAMKIAIEKVFDSSAHRFCMWNIMKNVSEKVGVSLNSNEEFNNKFKSCVWGSDTSENFEASWKSIMIEFGLQKNEWLSHMYNIRNMWIPTYFRDIFLAGVLRTTSRSESENSFYGNFLNPTIGLVEFWMRFESAIEAQRHKELLADNTSLHSLPILKLDRGLERHGRDIYTRENFYIFQNELWIGCIDCGVENINQNDGVDVLHIIDNSVPNGKVSEVVYNVSDYSSTCSCNMFQSQGIPCRHILYVLRGKGLNEIPNKYILNRWTKMATNKSVFNVDGKDLEGLSETKNERQLISEVWDHLYMCMHMVGQCKEKLLPITNGFANIKKQLSEFEDDSLPTKTNELESFIGFDLSKEVKIHPPQISKTKGSGKRIKGGKEKAIEQQQKRSRLCKACGQYASHDTRNCPSKSSP
ncbi:protein FAR1-RELATED SEQUENCE 5-like [Vicia villosa]|uniref:protein FAR1-RELATED SEQUENCE 5-like n=1 Tax=Vicia villosa TaxID=3911 RepID=UPI00273C701E|nr:protein FAR1-RELATED SEQUENCE 5-like [Vicia villosa]